MLCGVRNAIDTTLASLGSGLLLTVVLLTSATTLTACRSCVERQETGQYKHPLSCAGRTRDYTYLVYKPPGFEAPENADRRWPLLVYLTGFLTSGHDVTRLPDGDPPEEIEKGRDFPMVVLSPMTPTFGERWSPALVMGLVDEAIARYRVDPYRVYLTGVSTGANGVWSTAISYPERIAAILPVCGWGSPHGVERMKDVPVWAFHGGLDFVVWPPFHKRMVRAHQAAGGTARWTTVPWRCHNIWSGVYCRQDIYDWLLAQSKSASRASDENAAASHLPDQQPPPRIRPRSSARSR
jgi:predicted peptidase